MTAWQGSTRRSRLPANWASEIRPRILTRDHGVCHVCGHPGADEVDHVLPIDDHTDGNLAAIHSIPCHRSKSASEGGTAAWARRGQRRRPQEQHPGLVR